MGQLFEADSEKRDLTADERAYLMGAIDAVLAYEWRLDSMGIPESRQVCISYAQQKGLTPEWLLEKLIRAALDDRLSPGSTDVPGPYILYTLMKHFGCPNAPEGRSLDYVDPLSEICDDKTNPGPQALCGKAND